MKTHTYFTEYFEKNQLFSTFDYLELKLDKDDPVYTLIDLMEELDFTELISMYKDKGRKAFNPIMMFTLITYANMLGIRSVDEIVSRCERDLGFITIARGLKPKRDAIYNFRNNKLNALIIDNIHYQLLGIFKSKGYLNLKELFIDGTKIEANANRYTFVWRGTVNYHLINLLSNISNLMEEYNNFISENKYKLKYSLIKEKMFVIKGSNKVKRIIEENKLRKKKGINKLSNNDILEIGNVGPETFTRILDSLLMIIEEEKIKFATGKGAKKSDIQRLYEDFYRYGKRLIKYKDHFETMGTDRNSYSKTDIDATFMRMKDDHMLNGQLKPAYNLQYAIENYFIVDVYVSNDRTDYNTLIPVLNKHDLMTNTSLISVTADSGYCSEKNLSYCKENNIKPFIKLQTHETQKTRKYKNNIGKHFNMKQTIVNGEFQYTCHNDQILKYVETTHKYKYGFKQSFKTYRCESCQGCTLKPKCLYNYNEEKHKDKHKQFLVNHNWETLKNESDKNIQSDEGVIKRMIRSIQTEGTFGDMKENDDFRRLNLRSKDKVYKEFALYAIGRNINKYHRFERGTLNEYTH
ncbi:MAG: IS1182 family transposase [Tenericutes bacterium]|jgi:transposase|nr:IS1182 family transposase [Mycoplasmatota bacterium]